MRQSILGAVLIAGGFAGNFLGLPPWAAVSFVVLGALVIEPSIVGNGLKAIGGFIGKVRG